MSSNKKTGTGTAKRLLAESVIRQIDQKIDGASGELSDAELYGFASPANTGDNRMSTEIIPLPTERKHLKDAEAMFAIKAALGKLSEAAMDMSDSDKTCNQYKRFGERLFAEIGVLRVGIRAEEATRKAGSGD